MKRVIITILICLLLTSVVTGCSLTDLWATKEVVDLSGYRIVEKTFDYNDGNMIKTYHCFSFPHGISCSDHYYLYGKAEIQIKGSLNPTTTSPIYKLKSGALSEDLLFARKYLIPPLGETCNEIYVKDSKSDLFSSLTVKEVFLADWSSLGVNFKEDSYEWDIKFNNSESVCADRAVIDTISESIKNGGSEKYDVNTEFIRDECVLMVSFNELPDYMFYCYTPMENYCLKDSEGNLYYVPSERTKKGQFLFNGEWYEGGPEIAELYGRYFERYEQIPEDVEKVYFK